MSYKPSSSSGIMFDKHYKNAEKYRIIFFEQSNTLTFEALKNASKALYFWMLNENKVTGRKMDVNLYAHITTINAFKRNLSIVYKPLLNYL